MFLLYLVETHGSHNNISSAMHGVALLSTLIPMSLCVLENDNEVGVSMLDCKMYFTERKTNFRK
jgi:hypothetical protein